MFLFLLKLQILIICSFSASLSSSTTELDTLMAIKDSLDPENRVLNSWTWHSDPCSSSDASFEGVACNEQGLVTNISLQGKGLSGRIPEAVAGLKSLTGLYLHFNALNGILPKEIATLTQLTDLYLNVNNLSGDIPREIGNMSNLQVLQLCYNKFSGSIPTELGRLRKLSVMALQYNQLSSAIPASLGEVETLERLDLSFNSLFGPIPVTLAYAPKLESLDIRNNSLSGIVPAALRRLKSGFQYINNPGLCGTGFSNLDSCKAVSSSDPVKPEPYEPANISSKDLPASIEPEPENCNDAHCKSTSKSSKIGLVFGVIGVIVVSTISGLFLLLWHRRHKQKIGISDNRLSTNQTKNMCQKSASSLISLEYSNGWDPLAKGRSGYSQEVLESFMFNLEEVERATRSFSEVNLLGKSTNFSAVYRGVLRDGSVVTIKCIAKICCKSDEGEFLKGLKILTSLRHENLVRLRGFCCSKGRGECFLIYDSVSNGSLLQYLDAKKDSGRVLDWSTRVFIIRGIAKGIDYLHRKKGSKLGIVHQNISAENILVDARYSALLADSGVHKLLADDVVFSTLKASAAIALRRGCPLRQFSTSRPLAVSYHSYTLPTHTSTPPRNDDVPETSITQPDPLPKVHETRPPPQQPQHPQPPKQQEPAPTQNAAPAASASAPKLSETEAQKPKAARPRPKRRPRKAAMKLTPSAVEQLRELRDQPEPKLIKVGVRNRGCSGLAYNLEYVDKPGAFDETVEQDGVKVLIDSKALFSIIGSEMDYVEDKLNQRFVFKNPNIKEECGCGESFMV